MALQHNRLTQPGVAIKARPYLFDRGLLRELKQEFQAQQKAGAELVSLDGDPFIGADGPADRYVVKQITIADGKCRAEVYGVREGKEGEVPEVIPELELQETRGQTERFLLQSRSCFPLRASASPR